MNIFQRLFSDPLKEAEVEKAKRLIKDTHANVEATYGRVGNLGTAIVNAAFGAQKNLAQVFGFSVEGQPSEPQILMFYEFLYFFSHITLRTVAAEGFTEPQIKKLQDFLGPLLASTAVDSFFRHWPEDLKRKMKSNYFESLNVAEMEYSECRGLILADDPLNQSTLIGRLASNVAELWERSSDQLVKMAVASAATQAFAAMQLDRLVADVAPIIDSVDAELVGKFWKR